MSGMDFRIRIAGMAGLFVYYSIQFVVIEFHLNGAIARHNTQSLKGLEAVDILLLIVVCTFLLCKWLSISAVDRLVLSFDSVLFALSYSWLVLAAPVADILVGFYICNLAIATSIVALDLWEFRLFSSVYQRIRAKSNAGHHAVTGGGEVERNPLQTMEEGELEERERPSSESVDTEEDILRSVAIRSSANVAEVKYMPEVDLGAKGVLDGFRVNLDLLPEIDETIPRDLPWETFEDVQHTVDSSSCHIYTARWGATPVILKLIKEDRITSAVAVAEFDIEERVLSRVRHPHIVRLLGSGTQPRKFLVLEFLSGGTLSHSLGVRSDRVKQRWLKKFTLLETLKLAHGLAQALNYLHNEWSHSVHIIHRDLKPDNIGWSADGVLKLFDFGLSVSVRAQRERTEQYRLTGNTGTLRYMAPEVVLGRSYHQSVDTYSFGILIWQVAAGQIPFKDMGKKTYFDKVVMKGVRPQLDARWPPAFGELLRKCWHEDKNARPSFEEISRELAQLVADEEEIQSAKSNNIVARASSTCLHYVTLLHPLYIVVSVALLAASFVLSTQHRREIDNDVSAGAILAAFSALALYASLVNYLCGAWPLVPLEDPTAKLNFSVTAEAADGADQPKAAKKVKKDKTQPAEVELTQTHTAASTTKPSSAPSGGVSSLFGAARKSDRGIMMTDPSTQAPPKPPAVKDNGDEVEIGFNDHPPPAPSTPSKSRQGGRGLLAGLQEQVARGTGRAGKQSKRKEGAGTVIFSPLNNLHDEEDGEEEEQP